MPSGWAGGLVFMFVFLSFSISVTLRYHQYSQKSALASYSRHIHITKTQGWEGAWVWSLVCVKKHFHQYFLPAVTSQPVALTTMKGLLQPLLLLGRQTWVWGSDETCCFFAHGQLRPDPAHSKTRWLLFKKTHPDYASKQMIILYFFHIWKILLVTTSPHWWCNSICNPLLVTIIYFQVHRGHIMLK